MFRNLGFFNGSFLLGYRWTIDKIRLGVEVLFMIIDLIYLNAVSMTFFLTLLPARWIFRDNDYSFSFEPNMNHRSNHLSKLFYFLYPLFQSLTSHITREAILDALFHTSTSQEQSYSNFISLKFDLAPNLWNLSLIRTFLFILQPPTTLA